MSKKYPPLTTTAIHPIMPTKNNPYQEQQSQTTSKKSSKAGSEIRNKQEIEQAIEQLKIDAQNIERELVFEVNEVSKDWQVSIYDKNSNELIRTITQEELFSDDKLNMSPNGIIVKTKA